MKKILIIISLITVSITCVKAQLFMHLGPSDSLTVVDLTLGQSGLTVGIKDSLKPDIYIDGIKYDSNILDLINPEKIESMRVINGEAAIKEYNAPNGAILFTSKAAAAKAGKPAGIRIRAVGNIDSLDRAISVHRLSDVDVEKIMVFEQSRLLGNAGNIDSLDQAISIHRLSDEETEKIMVFEQSRLLGNAGNKTPLIVIDGKERSQEELSKLSPFDIESIKVLKGDEAMEKYNAPDGAIVVKTKK